MNAKLLCLLAGAIPLLIQNLPAAEFRTRVVASGLHRPTGIAAGTDEDLYFTEVPSPGVPNAGNAVKRLDLCTSEISLVHEGEPEPVNIALDRQGEVYWTCKSAGVVLSLNEDGEVAPVMGGLQKPSGIAVDRWGRIFITTIPTPGVPGTQGGGNNVSVITEKGIAVVNAGEPEPQDIAVSRKGELYWTCRTAGVILTRDRDGRVTPLLKGLNKPVGIALNRKGDLLYWTEVPTPGVGGGNGGRNRVWELNLRTLRKTLVHAGDPEPTDVAVDRDGAVYWTCSSAGVIVEARREKRWRD